MAACTEEHDKHSVCSANVESDDECPELEEENGDETPEEGRSKLSRNEKKARKVILRHGLKQMPNIVRVIIRKNKHVVFVVPKPDVYKSLASDTYVIFGEAKIEDLSSQAQSAAAQRFTSAMAAAASAQPRTEDAGRAGAVADEGAKRQDAEEVVDESGVDPRDIDLVVSQVECSRAKAVAALRENNNDIVEAIIQLSGS